MRSCLSVCWKCFYIRRILIYCLIKGYKDYLTLIIKDQNLPTFINNIKPGVMVNKLGYLTIINLVDY